MAKKLVNSFMANQIYWAGILKDGAMSKDRVNVTNDAIIAVMIHMKNMSTGKEKLVVDGLGELRFTPLPKAIETTEPHKP